MNNATKDVSLLAKLEMDALDISLPARTRARRALEAIRLARSLGADEFPAMWEVVAQYNARNAREQAHAHGVR